jgi:hypothetical protein
VKATPYTLDLDVEDVPRMTTYYEQPGPITGADEIHWPQVEFVFDAQHQCIEIRTFRVITDELQARGGYRVRVQTRQQARTIGEHFLAFALALPDEDDDAA